MPGGIFKPYAAVQTAILVFDKLDKKDGSGTDQVWIYNMEADGFSLDDKRNEIKDNDIPDIIARFNNLEAEKERTPYDKSFFVSIDDIRNNDYVLSLNKYQKKHIVKKEYRTTNEIMSSLVASEIEYINLLKETLKESYDELVRKVIDALSIDELEKFVEEKKNNKI